MQRLHDVEHSDVVHECPSETQDKLARDEQRFYCCPAHNKIQLEFSNRCVATTAFIAIVVG